MPRDAPEELRQLIRVAGRQVLAETVPVVVHGRVVKMLGPPIGRPVDPTAGRNRRTPRPMAQPRGEALDDVEALLILDASRGRCRHNNVALSIPDCRYYSPIHRRRPYGIDVTHILVECETSEKVILPVIILAVWVLVGIRACPNNHTPDRVVRVRSHKRFLVGNALDPPPPVWRCSAVRRNVRSISGTLSPYCLFISKGTRRVNPRSVPSLRKQSLKFCQRVATVEKWCEHGAMPGAVVPSNPAGCHV